MAEALRLGLVGAGAISQAYIKALEGSTLARWTGMADIRPEAAKAAAETMGCPAYDSHEDLVGKAGVDAVIVCTPPSTHTVAFKVSGAGLPRAPVTLTRSLPISATLTSLTSSTTSGAR